MEAWRAEFYRKNALMHHGIKGQKWGKKMGPPYPLDPEDHSAEEKKANWQESVAAYLKKYGSGSKEDKEEYTDDLDTKYEQATWHNKVDSRLNKVANNFNTSKEDLVNEYVKTSDSKKFLNLLSKSGVISESEKERLSKDENKAELESMRKAIVGQYDEKERRAAEKAASKSSRKSSGGSKSSGKSGGSTKKAAAKKPTEKEEPKAETWEKPLYSYLNKLRSKNGWSVNELFKNLVNSKGTNEDGTKYDELLVALRQSGAITDKEFDEYDKNESKLSELRKKVISYYKKIRESEEKLNSRKKKVEVSKELKHYGVSVVDGADVGSGRYRRGSGERPRAALRDRLSDFRKNSSFYKARRMSDSDLKSSIQRLKDEAEYVRLSGDDIREGRAFVENMVMRFGTKSVTRFVDNMAEQTGAKAAGKLIQTFSKMTLPKTNIKDGMKKEKEKREAKEAEAAKKEEKKKETRAERKAREAEEAKNERLADLDKKAKEYETERKAAEEDIKKNDAANKELRDLIDRLSETESKGDAVDNKKLKKVVDEHGKEAERLHNEATDRGVDDSGAKNNRKTLNDKREKNSKWK